MGIIPNNTGSGNNNNNSGDGGGDSGGGEKKSTVVIGGGSGGPVTIKSNPAAGGGTGVTIGGGGGGGPSPGGFGGGFSRGPRFPRRGFEAPNKDEHRINERIRIPQVRLIDHNGAQVGVVETRQALQMARDAGFDLVEISPNSSPPVCKILDYGKFKYEKKKKDHEAKKKQVVVKVKEVQLRPNTDDHDLEYKFKNIRTFLEEGDKAKITIMFRGREIAYVDNGHKIMARLAEMMKDIGYPESPAKLEGKKLMMILAPGKASGKPTVSIGGGIKPNPTSITAAAAATKAPETPSSDGSGSTS